MTCYMCETNLKLSHQKCFGQVGLYGTIGPAQLNIPMEQSKP
jgi:hypothetical protein